MFTGIVEEMGIIHNIIHHKNLAMLSIKANKTAAGVKVGDSMAVDGVCLTVSRRKDKTLSFEMMQETLKKTTIGRLKRNDKVNLERSLRVDGRLHGHFITGHVDTVVPIKNKLEKENYTELHIELNAPLKPYIAVKGSVCIDGISLTVGKVTRKYFCVYLIPYTKQVTTLDHKEKGDKVNVEADLLAKYLLNPKKGQ